MSVNRLICVVLVIDDLEYGGAQRQVVELANNINTDRFDVHVCALSDYLPLGRQLRDSGRRLHIIVKRSRVDVTVVPRLARLLKSLNADIVHSYLFSADIASRLAGRLAGTTVIIASERGANYAVKKRSLLAFRLTRGCIDLVIANSETGARFNSSTFGQPPSKYRVVYNGVDTTRFTPEDKGSLRKELGLPVEDHIVGIIAALKPEKNHSMLFQAFKLVLSVFPNSCLLIVGEQLYGNVDLRGKLRPTGEYHARMKELIDKLGIHQRCIFLGNRKDVERVYPACDITALPSLHEGTPNVLLESMACGVPVVATNVSDNSYVVKEGQTGFLVEVGDTAGMADRIGLLLANDTLRQEMGQKAIKWVTQQFTTERLVQHTEAVYLEALDGKSGK
jgi:glycosyltransferase involved in cell wall biosynthesis